MNKVVNDIENSLIYEMIKLFYFIAEADGTVSVIENQFVKNYLEEIYPKDFADELFRLFQDDQAFKNNDCLTVSRDIGKKYKIEDRLFILCKLVELTASDGIVDKERRVLSIIVNGLGISEDDYRKIIGFVCEGIYFTEKSRRLKGHLELFWSVDDTSLFPSPFQLLFVKIKSKLFVFNFSYEITLDGKQLAQRTLHSLERTSTVGIGGRLLDLSEIKCFIKYNKTTVGVNETEEGNLVFQKGHIETGFRRLRFENFNIEVSTGNETVHEPDFYEEAQTTIRASYDKMIDVGTQRISLRDICINLYKKPPVDDSLTIGNTFTSDIEIEDSLDETWQVKLQFVNNNILVENKGCPYDIWINRKRFISHQQYPSDSVVVVKNTKVFWNPAEEKFNYTSTVPARLESEKIKYLFQDNNSALDQISFEVFRGDMIAIMGPSGCGKSTLLNVLACNYKPRSGGVFVDAVDIHKHVKESNNIISFAPQDDLLFENLTVEENLRYSAKLRIPNPNINHDTIVFNVLKQVDLINKKNVKVGSPTNKYLSGGERKRLNIGLELLEEKEIYLFDEPTSGLSSKDSEKIISIIKSLTDSGKIVFVVIHQPNERIFKQFNKLILLDIGGKPIYCGNRKDIFSYIQAYKHDISASIFNYPEVILDIIEQPMLDVDGRPLSFRKYNPAFWQKKFLDFNKENESVQTDDGKSGSEPGKLYEKVFLRNYKLNLAQKLYVLRTLLYRNFKNKLKDSSNVAISFIAPPALGLLVSGILRYSNNKEYSLYDNIHLPTFLFLSVLIALFLGITNSIEEIIKDRSMLMRERKINVSAFSYLLSKVVTLFAFSVIQNILYLLSSFPILQLQELYYSYLIILTVMSLVGIGIGLFVSSFKNLSTKAATNLVPLILIPQIIFGGALIQYEQMNKQLTIIEKNPIPEICQVIPSRWGFEALVVLQGSYNSFDPENTKLQNLKDEYNKTIPFQKIVNHYTAISGNKDAAEKKAKAERDSIISRYEEHRLKYRVKYGNDKISTIMDNANNTLESSSNSIWVSSKLFSVYKAIPFTHIYVNTPFYNTVLLALIFAFFLFLTYLRLKIYVF